MWLAGEVVVAVVARHHPGVQVEEQEQWHRYFLQYIYLSAVLRTRIHRIHMFLSLLDPDPYVRGLDPDPDPSIMEQK